MIDFVIPPMFYVGAYILFAFIFALLGMLFAKKYKWQFSLIRLGSVILSALLSVVILATAAPFVGNALLSVVMSFVDSSEINDIINMGNSTYVICGLLGMVASLLLFVPVFFVVKAALNLILRCVFKPIFRAADKKKQTPSKEKTSAAVRAPAQAPVNNTPAQESAPVAEAASALETAVTEEPAPDANVYAQEMADENACVSAPLENEENADSLAGAPAAFEEAEHQEKSEQVVQTAEEADVENANESYTANAEATVQAMPSNPAQEEPVSLTYRPNYAMNVEEPKEVPLCMLSKRERKLLKNPLLARKVSPLSLLIGAACGFLMFNFIIAPMCCFMADIGKTASAVLSTLPEMEEIKENIDSVSDNVGVDIVNNVGGRLIYNGLASFKLEGEKITLTNEFAFAKDAAELYSSFNDKTASGHTVALSIGKTSESFTKTSLIPIVASDFLSEASKSWLKDKEFVGIKRPDLGSLNIDGVDGALDKALEIFKKSTPDTVRADFATLCEILSCAVDNGIIEAAEKDRFLTFLEKEWCVKQMIEALLKNERLSPLVATVTNLGISVLGDALSVPANDEEIYNKFIDDITSAVPALSGESQTDRALRVAASIKSAYDAAGIPLPKGAEYTIAATLCTNWQRPERNHVAVFFQNKRGELDLYEDMRSMANVGYRSLLSENQIIFMLNQEGVEGEIAFALAEKIYAKEKDIRNDDKEAVLTVSGPEEVKERSVRVTLEEMHIDSIHISNPEKESEQLAKIVSDAVTLSSKATSGKQISVDELMEGVGGILDALYQSGLLDGDEITSAVTGTLQSDTVRNKLKLSSVATASVSNNISESVKNGESYTKHLKAVGKTVNVITSNDTELSKENVKDLIVNVTPATSETLKELVSDEVLEGHGVPSENSGAVSDVFSSMFDEMAKVNESSNDSAYIEKEANAVSKAVDIATADSEKFKNGVFGTKEEAEDKINEYTDLISDSDIMKKVVVDTVYGDSDTPKINPIGYKNTLPEHERDLFVTRLDAMYKAETAKGTSGKELEEYEKLITSMAAFMNLEVKISGNTVVLK